MNFKLIHVSTWMSRDLSSGPSQRSHSSTHGVALRPVRRVAREVRPRPLCFGLPPLLQSGADPPGGSSGRAGKACVPLQELSTVDGPLPGSAPSLVFHLMQKEACRPCGSM